MADRDIVRLISSGQVAAAIGGSASWSLTFPATNAIYDLDFMTPQYFGGTQPEGNNTDDGRFFRQQIANTQPNYMEQADGSIRTFTATQSVRRTSKGLLVDYTDRNNRSLFSRDMTNAVWVKTNCTAAKNQTGRTGVANSASAVTVTSDGGTILQSRTIASATHKFYFDLKRITGTGTIEATVDGGTTWVPITVDAPRNNGWGRYTIAAQVVTNPQFGFRFGTSGDVFGIDFTELVDGDFVEMTPVVSPAGTTVKGWRDRPAALAADAGPLLPYMRDESVRCMFMEYIQRRSGGVITASTGSIGYSHVSSGFQAFSAAATTANNPNVAPNGQLADAYINRAMWWQTPTETGACLNGGTIATGTGASPNGAMDHWDLFTNGDGSASPQGLVRRLIFFDQVPPASVVQSFTAL